MRRSLDGCPLLEAHLPFTPDELAKLHAFRAAAAQVRAASIIDQGKTIAVSASQDPEGNVVIAHDLLDSEPFRSLAMSIRLVYLQGEPANYGHVCNILRRHLAQPMSAQVAELRKRFNRVLDGRLVEFGLHGELEGQTAGPRAVFETWLYHGTFHQEPTRGVLATELAKFGSNFILAVQMIGLRLSGCILDLDDLIADCLGEPRVHRIDPGGVS